jgi:hypothetical protein
MFTRIVLLLTILSVLPMMIAGIIAWLLYSGLRAGFEIADDVHDRLIKNLDNVDTGGDT